MSLSSLTTWLRTPRVYQIMSNVLLLLVSAGITQVLIFVAQLLTARYLGVAQYGQYTATLTLLMQASIILNFGLDTWVLREGAKSEADFLHQTSDALLFKLSLAGPWFILMVGGATWLNPTIYTRPLVAITALSFIGQIIGTLMQAAFKSQLRNGLTVLLQLINSLTFVTLTLFLVQRESHVNDFMGARLIAMGLMGGVGVYLFGRYYGWHGDWRRLSTLTRHSTPFFLAEALSYVYATADVTIIAIWLDKTAVGLYGPVIALINATLIIPSAIHAVILPILSRTYHHQPRQTQRLAIAVIIGLTAMGGGLTTLFYLFAEPLVLGLYGEAFQESATILAILSPILLLKGTNFACGIILTAINRQTDRVAAQTVAAILNVSLNMLIVQSYGLVGVAWVYLLTELVLLCGYGGLVWWRTQGLRFPATVVLHKS